MTASQLRAIDDLKAKHKEEIERIEQKYANEMAAGAACRGSRGSRRREAAGSCSGCASMKLEALRAQTEARIAATRGARVL